MLDTASASTSTPGAGMLAVADALAAEPRLAGSSGECGDESGGESSAAEGGGLVSVRLWRRGAGLATQAAALTLRPVPGAALEPVSVGGGGDGAAPAVAGTRARLDVVAAGSSGSGGGSSGTPLLFPPSGRLVATVADRALEATFDLPEPAAGGAGSTAGLAALPACLWLTVGLLAADGAALQLRLRRVARAARCAGGGGGSGGGGWAVYECVGGALTVRRGEGE
jgi:hypothetical protein